MAIGVDASKFKPRRVKSTPAGVMRNRVGLAALGIGAVCGLLFHFLPITEKLRGISDVLYTDPIEEIERKQMIFSPLRKQTGDQIRHQMELESQPNLPNK